MQEFQCLIISGDPDRRNRLKEALVAHFGKGLTVDNASNFDQAQKILCGKPKSCLFIFLETAPEELMSFLDGISTSEEAFLPPLTLLVLSGNYLGSHIVADLYLKGVQGFLCEPFSVNDVRELFIALGSKEHREKELRVKRSQTSAFLISNAMSLLDHAAKQKQKSGYAMKELRKVAAALRQVAPQLEENELQSQLVKKFLTAKTEKKTADKIKRKKHLGKILHPGIEVFERLERLGVTKERLLAVVEMEPEDLDAFLEGKRPLDEQLAHSLSRAVGETPMYWLERQRDFDSRD